MKKLYGFGILRLQCLLLVCFGMFGGRTYAEAVDDVNVLIGTTGPEIKYGGVCPWVTPPFGMTQWTPMSRENGISRMPYRAEDTQLMGFMGSHQPTVWMGDYGFITVMPQMGEPVLAPKERKITKVLGSEKAHPFSYAVSLAKDPGSQMNIRLTASSHCALFEVAYPEGSAPGLFVEMARLPGYTGWVRVDADRGEIVGYNNNRHNAFRGKNMGPKLEKFRGYFVIQFEQGLQSISTWKSGAHNKDESNLTAEDFELVNGRMEVTGQRIGAWVGVMSREGQPVRFRIGSSFISLDQARENLSREISGWDFDRVVNVNRSEWNHYLDRVQLSGVSADQRAIFYTALYHSFLFPRQFDEFGKYYSPFDEKIHGGVSYNDYSLWDTFRALHPLFTLLAPDRVSPMVQSLVQMYQQGGWMPKWPNPTYSNIMIGTPADSVIADAYLKGFRSFDVSAAYAAVHKDAMQPPEGDPNNRWADRADWTSYEARAGLSYYKELGYIPADKTNESVSRTLEDAYADYCVGKFADALGKADDAKYFLNRSKNYINVYDKKRGFMWPRLADGEFFDGDPASLRSFTESSEWAYLFCVMHDVPGLIDLMGRRIFIDKLDRNFAEGHYAYDNEPENHYPYLYAWVEQPWKTQDILTDAVNANYRNSPDGITGNDDCGQMSAWYIFTVMGFYPIAPGSGEYVIGRPFYPRIDIELLLPNVHTLSLVAHNMSEGNRYLQSVKVDGRQLMRQFITHEEILGARVIEYEMGSDPRGWELVKAK